MTAETFLSFGAAGPAGEVSAVRSTSSRAAGESGAVSHSLAASRRAGTGTAEISAKQSHSLCADYDRQVLLPAFGRIKVQLRLEASCAEVVNDVQAEVGVTEELGDLRTETTEERARTPAVVLRRREVNEIAVDTPHAARRRAARK